MRNTSSKEDDKSERGASLAVPLPVRAEALFKHSATPHVLNFLSDNPTIDVSIRQLATVTPVSERSTREAVDTLEANGLVETFHEGNARRVRINVDRLRRPDDPVLSIPQREFQTPVRVAVEYVKEELEDVRGIVLFGSVARGEADRRSDIDLWVLVEGDHLQQRHEANKLTQKLEGLQIPPTVAVADASNADFGSNWSEIKQKLENDSRDWASPERHSFEILVETPASLLGQSSRIDETKLFGEGVTLFSTPLLDRVKREVVDSE